MATIKIFIFIQIITIKTVWCTRAFVSLGPNRRSFELRVPLSGLLQFLPTETEQYVQYVAWLVPCLCSCADSSLQHNEPTSTATGLFSPGYATATFSFFSFLLSARFSSELTPIPPIQLHVRPWNASMRHHTLDRSEWSWSTKFTNSQLCTKNRCRSFIKCICANIPSVHTWDIKHSVSEIVTVFTRVS